MNPVRRSRPDARHPQQLLARRPCQLDGKAGGVAERPGGFRVPVECQVPVRPEYELVDAEAVLAEQVLGLVEPSFARRWHRRQPLHRRARHRLECAPVGMVKQTRRLEAADQAEQVAVRLTLGADDELGRRAGRRGQARPAFEARFSGQPSRKLELRQEIAREVLVGCEPPDHVIGGPFEVDRHATGESHGCAHLVVVGAGQHLEMEVSRESLPSAENLRGRQHAVHRAARAPGHSRGQEEPVGGAGAVCLHEGSRRFLGPKRHAPDLAAAERRAIATRERACIGLHDAHEARDATPGHAQGANPDRALLQSRAARQTVLPVGCGLTAEEGEPFVSVHGR
jgi:hypothetical protein